MRISITGTILCSAVLFLPPVLAAPPCANFSGDWTLTCRASDGSTAVKNVSIRQSGCDSIEINTKLHRFGQTETTHDADGTWTSRADWSATKTAFVIAREGRGLSPDIQGASHHSRSSTEWRLEGQKVTSRQATRIVIYLPDGSHRVYSERTTCAVD